MVNLEWFRTFKAIYRTGTLTGAAQELLISQPNVSQHLSSLEAHVGKQLFERQPRRMVPTEYGKLFYNQVISALEKLENVEAEFRYVSGSNVPLTCIGLPKEYFYTVLAPELCQAPANLVFEFGHTKQLLEKQLKGAPVFVVATHTSNDKELVFEPIREERFVLVGSAQLNTKAFDKHLAAGDMEQVEAWLCAQQWFVYSSDFPVIRRFWLANFKKRPAIKPRFVIPDYNAILKGISCGTAVTIASDYLVKELVKEKKLKVLWKGEQPATNTLYLSYNKQHTTTEQLEMMRKLLKIK
ncbi:LysR family transcriptional regulator [Chitinophaga vietnamensis]|uniref:LysR family transcriptional regulator n=1 Tax=Chitinophaga vietnamensis TaxID=2593957 RepID=UPI0011780981|nr:LysR family transcriptional regulator [Chitinophaga vietnamensis]